MGNLKQPILTNDELNSITEGLEFVSTTTDNETGIVEDYYYSADGFGIEDSYFYVQEIPTETSAGADFQSFKIGFGTEFGGDFMSTTVHTPLKWVERTDLLGIIKFNLSITTSLLG
jgi:hypothetical protein